METKENEVQVVKSRPVSAKPFLAEEKKVDEKKNFVKIFLYILAGLIIAIVFIIGISFLINYVICNPIDI